MSLNGLDSDAVTQAHEAALAEAGGWLLLNYVSRDTVELLSRGNGGVGEAKRAIESYEEKSPVYGLVQYRRKKIILKYVPEGTSRLLQVRLAVQFQSILDTFTPYDTVFSFTTAQELSESPLGLNTVLQSTGSLSSSSSSIRQQRLDQIAEGNEEAPVVEKAEMSQSLNILTTTEVEHRTTNEDLAGLPPSAARAKALLAKRRQENAQSYSTQSVEVATKESLPVLEERAKLHSPELPSTPDAPHTRASSIVLERDFPAPPTKRPISEIAPQTDVSIPRPSIELSLPPLESDSDDDVRRPVPKPYNQFRQSNHLSAAESSSISRWTDEVVASTRTKQKRGPRPHEEAHLRPKTSSNVDDTGPPRRVANLPTSVRVSARSSGLSSRPGSQQSTRSVPARFVASPNLPLPLAFPTSLSIPAQRPSVNRRPPSQTSSLATDNATVTPEKMRLMKALQMRKRNQLLAQRSSPAVVAAATPVPDLLASIDTTQAGMTGIPTEPSSPISGRRRQAPELGSLDESQTSPTSIITASDNHSTKPSSLSETSIDHHSHTSLSSETNSSTTPKAEAEKVKKELTGDGKPLPTSIWTPENSGAAPVVQTPLPKPYHAEVRNGSGSVVGRDESATDYVFGDYEEERGLPVSELNAIRPANQESVQVERNSKRSRFEGTSNLPRPSTETFDVSDDDSFMEELHNATVEEARPIMVNRTRTPVTPVLSRAPTRDFSELTLINTETLEPRSMSNGSQASTPDRHRVASRAGSARSISTALPQWPPQANEPVPTLLKSNRPIGSTISKRVKTFEGLSQRDSGASSATTTKDPVSRASSLSNMLKRASFLSHTTQLDKAPDQSPPRAMPSPPRAEFEDVVEQPTARPLVQRTGTTTEVYSPTQKGETVSITARIVRDQSKPKSAHGTSDTSGMHRSPLIIEHEALDNLGRPQLPRELTTQSMDSFATSSWNDKRRFSFSSNRTNAKNVSPVESRSHRLSLASHMKPQTAPSETSSMADDKRSSRASRMLRRISGLGRSRNKDPAIASPTQESLHPNTIEEQIETPDASMRAVVDIGEVNVQFPETLLWKRRFLRVDDQGYLIFAPPTNDFSTRGKSRKIHLDELLRPALPDLEREEMAWSIVLDLKNGGTVQCACESKEAQKTILKMLVDAHNAYSQLYSC